MAAIQGRKSDIYVVSGPGAGTAFTGEACTALSGSTTIFQIDATTKRLWSTATAPTVYDGGVATTIRYQIGYGGGIIVFESAPGGAVTVDGAYLSASKLGEGTGWSLDIQTETREDTAFGDTWKTHVVTQRGGSVTLERWFVDDYFLDEIVNPLVLVLYVDQSAGSRYMCLGKLTGNGAKNAANELVTENVQFVIDGPVAYNAT